MNPFLTKLADLLDLLGDTQNPPSAIKTAAPPAGATELNNALSGLSFDARTKIAEDAELSTALAPWLPAAGMPALGEPAKLANTAPTTDAERLAAAHDIFEQRVLAATETP